MRFVWQTLRGVFKLKHTSLTWRLELRRTLGIFSLHLWPWLISVLLVFTETANEALLVKESLLLVAMASFSKVEHSPLFIPHEEPLGPWDWWSHLTVHLSVYINREASNRTKQQSQEFQMGHHSTHCLALDSWPVLLHGHTGRLSREWTCAPAPWCHVHSRDKQTMWPRRSAGH